MSRIFDYEVDTFSKKGIDEKQKQIVDLQKQLDDVILQLENTESEIHTTTQKIEELVADKRNLQQQKSAILSDQKKNTTRTKFGITPGDIDTQIQNIDKELTNLHNKKTKSGKELQTLTRNKSSLESQINGIKNKLKNLKFKKIAAMMMQETKIKTGKKQTTDKITTLHRYNKQIVPEYEDSNTDNSSTPIIIKTVLDVFKSINRNIKKAFKTTRFENGESDQIYEIIPNIFVIRLNYEKLDNVDLIKIRFIQPGENKRSVVRMNITKKQQDAMVIERVRVLEKQFPMSCYLYLALVLCTFIRVNVVELMDTVDQLRKESTNSTFLNYRHKKYTDFYTDGIPPKYTNPNIYAHDLSYFSDYGFKDKYFNKYKAIFTNCAPMNSSYCEMNESYIDNNLVTDESTMTTFILMKRDMYLNTNDYYNELNSKLDKIGLSGLTSEQLCTKLPCMGNIFEGECTGDGYFKMIISDFTSTPTETPKFGTFNMFPYSAHF